MTTLVSIPFPNPSFARDEYGQKLAMIADWLDEQDLRYYIASAGRILTTLDFQVSYMMYSRQDAVLFKLTWGGK